jgi:hypothetical protein
MTDAAEFAGLIIAAAVIAPTLLFMLPVLALRVVCAAAAIIAAANALIN